MFKNLFAKIVSWYNRNYKANLYVAAGLLVLQLLHLYWMTTNIVMLKLFGREFWNVGTHGNILISLVDYTEIPAIILTSVFYLGQLGERFRWKEFILLLLINSQWIHLFWITDEVIVAEWTGQAAIMLPAWLAWCAILVDYLELPVIYDTIRKSVKSLLKRS